MLFLLALIKLKIIDLKQQDIIKRKEKSIFIIAKFANYEKTYATNFLPYILRYKANIKIKNKKKIKIKQEKKK